MCSIFAHFQIAGRLRHLSVALLLALLIGASAAGHADDGDQSGATAQIEERPESESGRRREGTEIEFEPSLSVSQGYSDNIFATRNERVDDFISVIEPELSFIAESGIYGVEVFGSAEVGRHWQNPDEDYEDYSAGAAGRYSITPRNSIFGGATYRFDHEPRASADDVAGEEPTTFGSTQAYAGTYNRFGRVTTRIGGTFERLDFGDVDGELGTINNDDRDRDLYTAGGRIGYVLTPRHEIFVQGAYDRRDYQSTADDLGFDRDSDGFNAALGLRYRLGRDLDAEVLGGYLRQAFDDDELDDVGAADFGARLDWRAGPSTSISAFVDRTLQETTLAGASGRVDTGVGVTLEQVVRRDLELEAGLAYVDSNYRGIGREDHVLDASLGLRYFLTPNVFAGIDYRFAQRDSNDPNEDYDESRVFASLGAQLSPAYRADTPAGGAFASGRSGLYIGSHAAFGNLGTELEGPRGSGGSLTADFADHGYGVGGFGGYGAVLGDWYLGLELDGEYRETDWDHARGPDGRVFTVDQDGSYGASALFGYVLPRGQLLYARFGGVLTDFDTDYVENGVSTPEDQTLLGLRLGGGVEVPIAGGAFFRLDYSYTAYEDYDVNFNAPGADNFANGGSTLRAGLGYRFHQLGDSGDDIEYRSPSDDFDGFYLGAQGGYGALNSVVDSARADGTRLDAEFGDEGATGGLFAGYGLTVSRLYLGLEAEGELSNTTWDHEREPVGRTFSVDKRHGYGGGARAGIVLGNSALLYGRAGIVRTNFRTRFERGGQSVERDDTETGLRFGGGVEIPVSDAVFLRFDYTYTDYEDYNIVLSDGGRETYDNSESLVRVGVGYRF